MDQMENNARFTWIERVLKAGMFACLLFTIIIYIFGQFIIRNESLYNSSCKRYDASWTYTDPSGETAVYRTHDTIRVEGVDPIRLELMLPEDLEEGLCLFFKTGMDLDAYVDGELRNHYEVSYSALGKNVKSLWLSVTLRPGDSGKKLVLERANEGLDTYFLQDVYLANRLGFSLHLIHDNIFLLFFGFSIVTFGTLIVVICLVYRIRGRKPFPLWYLSLAVLGMAFWLILDNLTYPLFFRNFFVDGVSSYLVILLVPFPFVSYIHCLTEGRYRRTYDFLCALILVTYVVLSALHFLDIAPFSETLLLGNITSGIVAIYCFVVILYDTFVKKHPENRIIAWGCCVFTVLCIAEIVHLNLTFHTNDGIFVAIGLMVLLINALTDEGTRLSAMRARTLEAQNANNAKTAFLANMSHEIRTPINAILGMDELILREDTDDKVREYAQNIKEAGTALLEIISDVLDFSKIEQGKMEILNGPYEIGHLFNSVLTMIRAKTDEKGLALEGNLSEEIPYRLIGDEKGLREIAINLLGNSVKYTQKGTVTLSMHSEPIDESHILLCISVKDTGIGIKDSDRGSLFKQFERLDLEKNRSIEGAGLGLAITANLVALMGGTIDCKSKYGEGSEFIVKIPQEISDRTPIGDASRYDAAAEVSSREDDLADLTGVRVLVVDDTLMNLKVASGLLNVLHAEVTTCSSGEEMLELIVQQKFDLILLDHMMPEMDGIEALRKAGETEGNQNTDTPYIAMTANAIAGAKEMYLENGFADYLSKPMKIQELSEVIRKNH
jgi:signal transduction histidine kinase